MKKELKKKIKKIDKRGKRVIDLLTLPLTKLHKNDIYKDEFTVCNDSYVDDKKVFHLVVEYDIPLGKLK